MEYIRNKSAAKSAASSPPAPPRISTITFLSSLGSLGKSNIFNSSLTSAILELLSEISSSISSFSSLSSSPDESISLASSMFSVKALYSRYLLTMGPMSLCSLQSFRHCSWSAITAGSLIFNSSSLKRSSIKDNLSNILCVSPHKY